MLRLLTLFLPFALLAADPDRVNLNLGSGSNDGTGDGLRTTFTKINTNVINLWAQAFTNNPASIAEKLDATSGTVVNLTGSLTNVAIYGGTVIDTGDELQDTVDYGLALTPNGNTATSNDASARPRSVATISALVTDVDPLMVPTYARISVLGYHAAGDGGGGDFRRVLASSGTTNVGTFFASTANALYAWERLEPGGEVSAKWFGAKGDGIADDSAAIQSAIDYIETENPGGTVLLPGGDYLASGLLLKGVTLRGNGYTAPRGSPTTIYQPSGDTNDVVTTPGGSQVQGKVIGIRFRGAKDHSERFPRIPIVSATSRTLFTVATNALPTASPNVSAWPFYGYAFFRSSEGRYLGSAIVQSVNTGTGEVTINDRSDWYATPAGSGNLLTTNCTVVFSPVTVSGLLPVLALSTNNSPASAGNAAIRVVGGEAAFVQDCSISGFHVGIVLDTALRPIIDDVWISACDFAGIAAEHPSKYYDLEAGGVAVQGFYTPDYLSAAETNTFDGELYRRTTHGIWTGGRSTLYDSAILDGLVLPFMANEEQDVVFKYLMLDQPVDSGIWSRGQSAVSSGMLIESLMVRPSLTSLVTTGPATNVFSAIRLRGATERWRFGTVQIPFLVAGHNFDYAFEITSTNAKPSVRSFGTLTGVDAINNTSAAGWITLWVDDASSLMATNSIATGFYRPALGELSLYAGTSNIWKSSISGTLHARPLGIGPAASASETNMLDVSGQYIRIGGDELSPLTRTTAKRKDAGIVIPGYNVSDKDTSVMLAFNDASTSAAFFGFSSGAYPRNTLTLIRMYVGSSKTSTPVSVFSALSSGLTLGATNVPVSVSRAAFGLGQVESDVGTLDGQLWYRTDTDRIMGRINGANVSLVTAQGSDGSVTIGGTLTVGSATTIRTGTGSPEGVVTANVGSLWLRTDGGAGTTLYVKESGTGNTGWVSK